MLLEVSELFEEVVEEQLKMAVREVPPMFRRWFSDGQQAENMLRYMKWDDGIMGQCFIFMFRIICLKGCFIFKPWKWDGMKWQWDDDPLMFFGVETTKRCVPRFFAASTASSRP